MSSTGIHPKFNAADADLSVASSDNILFRIHSAQLQANSTAFPGLQSGGSTDVAKFDEPSKVLEVLFAFLYPDPTPPSLRNVSFDLLEPLAYAAHKYGIGGAITVCHIRLIETEKYLSDYPLEMLRYALRYLPEEVNRFARRTIAADTIRAMEVLDRQSFYSWVLYRDRWLMTYFSSNIWNSAQNSAVQNEDKEGPKVFSGCIGELSAKSL